MARSVFYYHKNNSFSKTNKYTHHKLVIKQIYDQHKGRYGYCRITAQMNNMGYAINKKTVLKLMRELDLKAKKVKVRYNSYSGETQEVMADNVIARNFHCSQPYMKWATDITQIKIKQNWLYLSPILDMFNGEIISYSLSYNPNTELVNEMLTKAFKKVKQTKDIIIHSDRGKQYQAKAYRDMLEKYEVLQSMSRKGNCYDNAMMESFFGSLKTELLYNQSFKSEKHFIEELHKYMKYYNNTRIKNRLNGMSPVQYRAHHYRQI